MEEPKESQQQLSRLQNTSLRSPHSYPDCISPAEAFTFKETSSTKGNFEEKIETEGHKMDSRKSHSKSQRLHVQSKHTLYMDYDVSLFQMSEPLTPKSCHYCGLHAGSSRCSSCKITYYCSVECQRKDWINHSVICNPAVKPKVSSVSSSETAERKTDPMEGSSAVNHMKTAKRKITLSDLNVSDIKENVVFEGLVVDFSNPGHFYLQVFSKKSVESLLKLSMELNEIYGNQENLSKGYVPAAGEVCVAKYTHDQHWYRALVENVELSMKTALVLYLDYGNQEVAQLDDLHPMHKDLELIPPAALRSFLANIIAPSCGWSPECLVEARTLLLGQHLSVTIVHVVQDKIPSYAVDISLLSSGLNISKLLLERRYAIPAQETFPIEIHPKIVHLSETSGQDTLDKLEKPSRDSESQPQTPICKMIALCVGDVFNAVITDIQSPGDFFCQQLQNAKELAELMKALSKHCRDIVTSTGFAPSVGDLCCAQFTEDGRWYRASIVSYASKDSVLVGYVDFGNLEVLPVSRLRPILPSMMTFPLQAIKCTLAGVKPPSKTWTKEATSAMMALVASKVMTVKVVDQTEFSLIVDLLDTSVTPEVVISKCLIEAGVAVRKEAAEVMSQITTERKADGDAGILPVKCAELPFGQGLEVVVCTLQSPGYFFCQILNEKDLISLREVNLLLNQYCMRHQSREYNPKAGDLCCAFFPADKNWYRARVAKVSKTGKAKVCFLDYGNTEEVTIDQLCQLPFQFLELPFQAIKCSLEGLAPIGNQWTQESNEIFQMCVVGHKLQARAIQKTEDGYSVDLIDLEIDRSIGDILIALKAALGRDVRTGLSPDTSHLLPKTVKEETSSCPLTFNCDFSSGGQEAAEGPSTSAVFELSSNIEQNTRTKNVDKESVTPDTSLKRSKEDIGGNREWKSIELPLNKTLQARVSYVVNPGLFYVIPKEIKVDKNKLKKVLLDLAGYCHTATSTEAFKPSTGDICCAKFTGDGQWHRALVLNILENAAEVVYADYGYLETLPLSSLLPISESCLETPVQVVKCSLAGVTSVSGEWSPASIEMLRTLVQEKLVSLTALNVDGGLYSVSVEQKLSKMVLKVSEKLVSEGLARSTVTPSTILCKSGECCCQDVLKRVEKLENIIKHLLQKDHL